MVGNCVYQFEVISSTQCWIKENYSSLRPGDVCIAKQQLSGRGRYNRRWFSSRGGLYFSFLLRFEDQRHRIGFYLAVAVVNALKFFNDGISVKWPNDIYYNGKKLCGMLVEHITDNLFVCGVGINIFNEIKELGLNAVTLSEILSYKCPNLEKIFWLVVSEINEVFDREFDEVYSSYRAVLWGIPGNWIVNLESSRDVILSVLDIDRYGRLVTNLGVFSQLEVLSINGKNISVSSR